VSRYLVTPGQLERILHRRARGDRVQDIAKAYNLDPMQISRLIHKFKPRLIHICQELGVAPPRHGGRRKASGRKKAPDEKKARYLVNYHAYAEHSEPTFVTLVCLKCGEEFESEDRVNERICKVCKQSNVWNSGSDFGLHHMHLTRSRHD